MTELQFKGRKIQATMRERGIKLIDLAILVGKTNTYLSSRLNKNSGLSLKTLRSICRILNLNLSDVIEN